MTVVGELAFGLSYCNACLRDLSHLAGVLNHDDAQLDEAPAWSSLLRSPNLPTGPVTNLSPEMMVDSHFNYKYYTLMKWLLLATMYVYYQQCSTITIADTLQVSTVFSGVNIYLCISMVYIGIYINMYDHVCISMMHLYIYKYTLIHFDRNDVIYGYTLFSIYIYIIFIYIDIYNIWSFCFARLMKTTNIGHGVSVGDLPGTAAPSTAHWGERCAAALRFEQIIIDVVGRLVDIFGIDNYNYQLIMVLTNNKTSCY